MENGQWQKMLEEKHYITSHDVWEEVKKQLEEKKIDATIVEGRYKSIGGRTRYNKWLKTWQKELTRKWVIEYEAMHTELSFDEALTEREIMELRSYCVWLWYNN
jgi:hypothetical protein